MRKSEAQGQGRPRRRLFWTLVASREIEQSRRGLELFKPHGIPDGDGPRQEGVVEIPLQGQLRVDDRAESLWISQLHLLALCRHVELTRCVPVQTDPAPESYVASTQRRFQPIEADAARVEQNLSVDRFQRMRKREMPNAAIVDERPTQK